MICKYNRIDIRTAVNENIDNFVLLVNNEIYTDYAARRVK